MTPRLPSAPSGNGPLTLIGAELQRQEESLCLLQQLKTDLHTLTTALHAALDVALGAARRAPRVMRRPRLRPRDERTEIGLERVIARGAAEDAALAELEDRESAAGAGARALAALRQSVLLHDLRE